MSPLAQKVAEVIDEAIASQEGAAVFRGTVAGEEWKITADYDGLREAFITRVLRRDRFTE